MSIQISKRALKRYKEYLQKQTEQRQPDIILFYDNYLDWNHFLTIKKKTITNTNIEEIEPKAREYFNYRYNKESFEKLINKKLPIHTSFYKENRCVSSLRQGFQCICATITSICKVKLHITCKDYYRDPLPILQWIDTEEVVTSTAIKEYEQELMDNEDKSNLCRKFAHAILCISV